MIKIATAQNQPEAELIQNRLLEQGVPTVIRRTPGFDVPEFLAAGPRDVLVFVASEQTAREVLNRAAPASPLPTPSDVDPWWRVLVGLITALTAVAVVVWCLGELLG